MPLILAIEPDRHQAAHLASMVRRDVGADLILVDTTERALDAIGNQVPDLVLVPALLSPHDDAALATALRVIAAAAHVQMLTIPVLGARRPSEKPGGVLNGLRRDRSRSAEPEGCDPQVFAEQIASYLEQAAQERADLLEDAAPDDTERRAPAEAVLEDMESVEESPVLGMSDVVEVMQAEPPDLEPAEEAAVESPRPEPVEENLWGAVEDALRSQFLAATPEPAQPSDASAPVAEETVAIEEPLEQAIEERAEEAVEQLVQPIEAPVESVVDTPRAPVIDEHMWLAVEQAFQEQFSSEAPVTPELEPPTVDIDLTMEMENLAEPDVDAEGEDEVFVIDPVATLAPPETAPPARGDREWVELIASLRHDIERLRTEGPKPAPKPAAPRSARSTRAGKASENEWGLFDPEQCGFAALLAKLDEVTESDETLRA